MDDFAACKLAESGKPITDRIAFERAYFRGLIELDGRLTKKGDELLHGIEPTACSGWHMGGAEPVAWWVKIRRTHRARQDAKVR